jgi:hypothetical protein
LQVLGGVGKRETEALNGFDSHFCSRYESRAGNPESKAPRRLKWKPGNLATPT